LHGASPGRARVLPHVAAVVVAVIMFALIYDPFHAGAVSFLALTPITLVFADPRVPCSLRRAALCGFAFGWSAALAIVGPWMFAAAVDYFERGVAWSFGFTLLINAGYVALFYVPVFVAIRLMSATAPLMRALGAASVWIAFEALRAAEPTGNAWALLGQGLVGIPVLRESAAFGGVWLLGGMAALCGAAIGVGLQPDLSSRDTLRCCQLAVVAPIVLVLLGAVAGIDEHPVTGLPVLRVAVVQQEVPSNDVWNPAERVANWNRYLAATESLEPLSVDLVVWPESAVPFLLNADAAAGMRLEDLATRLDAAILVGAPRSQTTADGRAALFNSAYLFSPATEKPRTYDKRRLLPFVESGPVTGLSDAGTFDYSAGKLPSVFEVKKWRIAPLLCFEGIYPRYARDAVLEGANLLVNLSNDAWFAGGAGPEQHHAMSVLRTVEIRRPMVRASNGGISAAVNPKGESIGFPIRRQKAVRVYSIPPPPREMTVTAKSGDFVPWIAGLIAAIALIDSLRPRKARVAVRW